MITREKRKNTYAIVAAGTVGINIITNSTFRLGEDELLKVSKLTDFHAFVLNNSVMFNLSNITLIESPTSS